MSLFNWFKRKPAAPPQRQPSHAAPLRPETPAVRSPGTASEVSLRHRNERTERREQLYGVVRDAMVRAGILSASYKFKVLALDQRGHQFLVMMDLAREYGSESARLSSIENVIAQTARTRHAIAVTAVYWRINDQIASAAVPGNGALRDPSSMPAPPVSSALAASLPSTGAVPRPSRPVAPAAAATGAVQPRTVTRSGPAAALPHQGGAPRYDPIEAEEVAAFRQALAGAASSKAPGVAAVPSGARRPSFAETGFPETQLPDEDSPRTRGSDLSTTQYGDL